MLFNFLLSKRNNLSFFILALFLNKVSFSQTPTFTSLGPKNYNTSIHVVYDPNDISRKKVWACGAGLWYCDDITNINAQWQDVSSNLQYSCFQEVYFHPSNSQIVYAIARSCHKYEYNYAFYKSENGGQSWNLVYEETAYLTIFITLKVAPNGDVFMIKNGQLVKSTNNGVSWQVVFNTEVVNDYDFKGNLLIIGTKNGKVFQWNNGVITNISPSTASTAGYVEIASFSTSNNSLLYVLCREKYNGFVWGYKTSNDGATWTSITLPSNSIYDNFYFGTYPFIFEVNPLNDRLLICGQKAITSSSNWGQSWLTPSTLNQANYAISTSFNGLTTTSELLIAKEDGIYKSSNWGLNYNNSLAISKLTNNLQTGVLTNISQANRSSKTTTFIGGYTKGFNSLKNNVSTEIDWHPCFWIAFDEDEHNKVLTYHSTYYQYGFTLRDSTGVIKKQIPVSSGSVPNVGVDYPFDYNSQYNTIWTYKSQGGASTPIKFMKASNVGEEEIISDFEVNLPNESFMTLRSGLDDSTFFWGSSLGFLYKATYSDKRKVFTNIKVNQSNKFQSEISSIDVASNGYIVCSLWNYGFLNDIWFSPDNGQTWENKHTNTNTLPLNGYYTIRLNPNNPKQVILISYNGKVWACDDITASTPQWYNFTSTLPKVPFSNLHFKKSSGELLLTTGAVEEDIFDVEYSRGLYKTGYYTNTVTKRLESSKKSYSICKTLTTELIFPFMEYGSFSSSTSFFLELSDAAGNFTSPVVLQTISESPFKIQTGNLPLGSFKLRVRSSDGFISDEATIAIIENKSSYPNFPRIINITERSFIFQFKHDIPSTGYYILDTQTSSTPTQKQLTEGKNASGFAALYKGTLIINSDSLYSLLFSNMAPGDKYRLYYTAKNGDCFTTISAINIDLKNLPSTTFCTPNFSSIYCGSGSTALNSIYFSSYTYGSSQVSATCSNFGYSYSSNIGKTDKFIQGLQNATLQTYINVYYYDPNTPTIYNTITAWLDKNQNNQFDTNEQITLNNISNSLSGTKIYQFSANIKATDFPASQDYYRMRIMLSTSANPSPCQTASFGLARDFYLYVEPYNGYYNALSIFSNMTQQNVSVLTPFNAISTIKGNFNTGNTFKYELSDSLGVFDNPTVLASGITNVTNKTLIIPSNTPNGSKYKIRVVSSNPVILGSPSNNFTIINSCIDDIIINTSITQSQQIKAGKSIIISGSINPSINVEAAANKYILLAPGFSVNASENSLFKTSLSGCN